MLKAAYISDHSVHVKSEGLLTKEMISANSVHWVGITDKRFQELVFRLAVRPMNA